VVGRIINTILSISPIGFASLECYPFVTLSVPL